MVLPCNYNVSRFYENQLHVVSPFKTTKKFNVIKNVGSIHFMNDMSFLDSKRKQDLRYKPYNNKLSQALENDYNDNDDNNNQTVS